MKYLFLIVICFFTGFIFNFHIIHTDRGFDLIAKDTINLREIYVDARNFDTSMLIDSSPRVSNYLLYQVYGPKLLSQLKETTDDSTKSLKEKLRISEQNFHKWLSEKLK
ncbi:hypothetical protein QUF70_16805 [Desulfobacterales bacterium HSG17]|nr:hypothetical protein [Desulfobacterales bacterium HSG17]